MLAGIKSKTKYIAPPIAGRQVAGMELRIRRAKSSDAGPLGAAFARAYVDAKRDIADLPDVATGLRADIAEHLVWIAETGAECVGGLVLSLDGRIAHLMNVAVVPAARGIGVGRQLIDTALTAARTSGCRVIYLATHKDMPGNIALYQRLGWSVTGHDGNKILMSRPL